ncbi:hypothetical protein BH20GEM2_BH20GEM2_21100 [soil metagenome]|jgi:hypothetical protein
MMSKLLGVIGATVGGGLGWAAGAGVGITTAFVLGMIGTGIGMYLGARIARDYF